MTNPKIEQLRQHFYSLNSEQKGIFINTLKRNLQQHHDEEYSKLLDECVHSMQVNDPFHDLMNVSRKANKTIDIAEPFYRLQAFFVDTIFMFLFPVMCIAVWISVQDMGIDSGSPSLIYNFNNYGPMFGIAYFIYAFFLQMIMWSDGTSYGKSARYLSVIDKDNGMSIGIGWMMGREIFGKLISGLLLGLGYIWILIDKDNQGWHDKFVESIVIFDKKRKKDTKRRVGTLIMVISLLSIVAMLVYLGFEGYF